MANKQNISVALLQCNEGQIEGLSRNPRFIKDERFKALVKSLRDDPEMLDLRELIVFPHGEKYVVIGGNMRLRAGKELGFETMPCKILPAETPIEKLKAYTIKDNNAFGNDDFDLLENEWDAEFLEECGFDFETFYSEAEHSAWERNKLKSVIFETGIYSLDRRKIITTARARSDKKADKSLSDIKQECYVEEFADRAVEVISGIGIDYHNYTLVVAPRRRTEGESFTEKVGLAISEKLKINYNNPFECKNRARLNPIIEKKVEIPESNIILYDDIISTGCTIRACLELLEDKNVIVVVGVKNQ